MTRKWKNNKALVQAVRLFLVDEVHLLNDESRGPTMEAVISRMKTVKTTESRICHRKEIFGTNIRFLAVSATIPNANDIGKWLETDDDPTATYSMDDSYRPVKLRKVVIGYPCKNNITNFRFDLSFVCLFIIV
ncbi:probable ATP-dependent DNA helicase HFM1 [Xenia sp. Carnegie-2017]|uniref:probable ATP-dependent DNA helicase HFM1 n=1 Tax=Xenia sp. Carnegie-2017 TaxID=2897299 RepID=UPI001F04E63B|nr:probable ATP-dependent DNA helicase HFM1 [Xenia sp. Carnegie-2017]